MLRSVSVRLFAILFLATAAWGQANVNESLETALYWVDVNTGSDANPGTQAKPFQTIGFAVSVAETNNQNGVGSHITVNPGVYREAVTMTASAKDTNLPITIQAASTGTAILSGADVYTGWTPYSGNSHVFTTVWPNQFGLCSADNGGGPYQEDIVLRREIIAVNGVTLTQVLSIAQMRQGSFYVDEAGATVYIWPPNGTNIATATVEVANRPELLTITNKSNVVVRGMTFQYASSCRMDSALPVNTSNNILLDTDYFYWNNAKGPGFGMSSYITVQNSIANHNGAGGMGDYETLYGLFTNNVTNYNNWRGAQGAYYRWSSTGFHPFATHNNTIQGLTTAYNQAYGIHWDTDNMNVNASGIVATENYLAEGFSEKNEGPITITNSYFCNGAPLVGPVTIGFELRNSEQVSLNNSVLANDEDNVEVLGVAGGISVTNWETEETYNLVTQKMGMNGDLLVSGSAQSAFSDSMLGGADWTSFVTTLNSNNNQWWNGSDYTPFVVPVPVNYTQLSLASWQSTTGQDAGSTWQAPPPNYLDACTVTPEAQDFWLVIDPLSDQLMVNAGQPASFTFTITGFGGFTDSVGLISDGVQNIPGATASWDTQLVSNGSGTATLTISTTKSTPTGVYPVTVVANSGTITRMMTASVLVNTATAVDPLVDNLGSITVGSSSGQFINTINNFGTTALTVNSIATTGDFSQTNTCGTSIPVGGACAVSVLFTPTQAGTRTGTLQISTADPGSPQTVALTGVGIGVPVVNLSGTALTYSNTDVNSLSLPQVVTMTNVGTATLSITSITLGGKDQGDYYNMDTCGATLAPGSACYIGIVFEPLVIGSRVATLYVSGNASNGNQTLSLSGSGVTPLLTFSTQGLIFPTQKVGTTSAPLQATLTNTGTGPLLITSLVLNGINPGDFGYVTTCPISPSTLAVGASCTVTGTFTPTTTGLRTAQIVLSSNLLTGPKYLFLTGIGTKK